MSALTPRTMGQRCLWRRAVPLAVQSICMERAWEEASPYGPFNRTIRAACSNVIAHTEQGQRASSEARTSLSKIACLPWRRGLSDIRKVRCALLRWRGLWSWCDDYSSSFAGLASLPFLSIDALGIRYTGHAQYAEQRQSQW